VAVIAYVVPIAHTVVMAAPGSKPPRFDATGALRS
jgi:hypothetical protein